jgi:hypothetical protein
MNRLPSFWAKIIQIIHFLNIREYILKRYIRLNYYLSYYYFVLFVLFVLERSLMLLKTQILVCITLYIVSNTNNT